MTDYNFFAKYGLDAQKIQDNQDFNDAVFSNIVENDELFDLNGGTYFDPLASDAEIEKNYQAIIDKIAEDLKIIKPTEITEQTKLEIEQELKVLQEEFKSLDDAIFGYSSGETKEVINKNYEYTYDASLIKDSEKTALIEKMSNLGNFDATESIESLLKELGEIKVTTAKEMPEGETDANTMTALKDKIKAHVEAFYDSAIKKGEYTNSEGQTQQLQDIIPSQYYSDVPDISYLDENQHSVLSQAVFKSHKTESDFSALHNTLKELKNDYIAVGKDASNLDLKSYMSVSKALLSEIKANGVEGEKLEIFEQSLADMEKAIDEKAFGQTEFSTLIYNLQLNASNLDKDTITYMDYLKIAQQDSSNVTKEQLLEILPETVTLKNGVNAVVDNEVVDFAYAQIITNGCYTKEEVANIVNNNPELSGANKARLIDVLWEDLQTDKADDQREFYVNSIVDSLVSAANLNNSFEVVQKEYVQTISDTTTRQLDKLHLASKEASFDLVDLDYIQDALLRAYTEDHGPGCTCWIHKNATKVKAGEMADAVKNSLLDYQNNKGSFDAKLAAGGSIESFVKDVILNTENLQSSCGSDKETLINKYLFSPEEGSLVQNIEYNGTLELRHMKNTEDTNSSAYKMKDMISSEINGGENIISDGVSQYLTEVSAAIIEQYYMGAEEQDLKTYFVENLNAYLNPDEVEGTVFYENFGAVLDFTKGESVSEKIAGSEAFAAMAEQMEIYHNLEMQLLEKASTLNVLNKIDANEYEKRVNAVENIEKTVKERGLNVDLSAVKEVINDNSSNQNAIQEHFSGFYKNLFTKNISGNNADQKVINFSEIKANNFFKGNETPKKYAMLKNSRPLGNDSDETQASTQKPKGIGATISEWASNTWKNIKGNNEEINPKEQTESNQNNTDQQEVLITKTENKAENKTTSPEEYDYFNEEESNTKKQHETLLDDLMWKRNTRRLTSTERYNILDSIDEKLETDLIKKHINSKLNDIESSDS